jgi:hypothetical protein
MRPVNLAPKGAATEVDESEARQLRHPPDAAADIPELNERNEASRRRRRDARR